ncbi:hypothetical protein G210_1822, partial [Candida maltosa Xu316]
MIGYSNLAAISRASLASLTNPDPGTNGTPAFSAISLAECFNPNFLMASPEGPTNTIPSLPQRSEKSAFSDKNP